MNALWAIAGAVSLAALALPVGQGARGGGAVYEKDVAFALDALEKECGHFFKQKGIDWSAVRKQFSAEVKSVKSDSEHWKLLVHLLARLRDGHAEVRQLEKGKNVKYPNAGEERRTGPGLFLCRSGKTILVKNAWAEAARAGIEPGSEVLEVDGQPAAKWLDARIALLRDTVSFSTEQQAFFFACHWGLADAPGTRREFSVKTPDGKTIKRTITYGKASFVPSGAAYPPAGLQTTKDLQYGKTASGFGYIHLRRAKEDLPEQTDTALAAIGAVPGLILDLRANGGGGMDHEAFLGRFVPQGKTLSFGNRYGSAGPNPYGGPIVVLIDGNVRSTGETASGIFKEDGRAYMIGESATAGMSSQKKTLELPSQLFGLYVSVASNKGRFNGGRGIEGIGVIPHEVVEFAAKDLAAKADTLILRAEELLKKGFPKGKVPYDPAAFGWKP